MRKTKSNNLHGGQWGQLPTRLGAELRARMTGLVSATKEQVALRMERLLGTLNIPDHTQIEDLAFRLSQLEKKLSRISHGKERQKTAPSSPTAMP